MRPSDEQPLNKSQSRWLALGLLRSPRVMASAASRVSGDEFLVQEMALKILWKIGTDWHKKYGTPVQQEYISELVANDPDLQVHLTEDVSDDIVDLIQFCYVEYKSDTAAIEGMLLDHLQLVLRRSVRDAARALATSDDVAGSYLAVSKALQNSNLNKVQFIDPFADEVPVLSNTPRIPLGVDFLDDVCGGTQPGDTTLFLAPSGGGKTLTNVQVAVSSAFNGDHSLLLSYEQNVKPNITARIYACAMGLPVDAFQNKTLEEYLKQPDMMARYQSARERIRGRVHCVDMLEAKKTGSGSGGAEEVETAIRALMDSGITPRYVGLDWLGPMVESYMASSSKSNVKKYENMISLSDQLRQVSQRLKVNIFIYHQLGTEGATRPGFHVPKATDAHECRSLHHYMDNCICIGPRDPKTNIAVCGAPKIRNAEPNRMVTIRMDGRMSRWVLEPNVYFPKDRGRIVLLNQDGTVAGGESEDSEGLTPVQKRIAALPQRVARELL